MKWRRKYMVNNLEELYQKHLQGYSLAELGEEIGIQGRRLGAYFRQEGWEVYFNRYRVRLANQSNLKKPGEEYRDSVGWKYSLIRKYGYLCQIANCGYDKFLEAHHIIPRVDGGKCTVENGALLCPNHHAEAHGGLIDLVALVKRGELLGRPGKDNQQPSRRSNEESISARVAKGSETRGDLKEPLPRAPRLEQPSNLKKLLQDDIVRTVDMIPIPFGYYYQNNRKYAELIKRQKVG